MSEKHYCMSPVVIDNNALAHWTIANESDDIWKRLNYLFKCLEQNNQQLIIPAPVVAEFLVHVPDERLPFLEKLRQTNKVKIVSFDFKAAMECAILTANAKSVGDKRYGGHSTLQKIKVDEQIVAIAKVIDAKLIVSDDKDIKNIARSFGIVCKKIKDLDLPPLPPQGNFFP